MRIVIIGGSGLIGSRLAAILRQQGHEVVPASPSTGVDTLTGEGLGRTLEGAEVVVDVANSPSFEAEAVLRFFETSGRNVAAAEMVAEIRHHVALSVVGTGRLHESGYFRAKDAQERLVRASGIPHTIVRATQFLEFLGAIAESGAAGQEIRLPPVLLQPIAADDVAAILADVATSGPADGVIEIAGPEPVRMDELVRRHLLAKGDPRQVVADPGAAYFGQPVDVRSLTPADGARLGPTRFDAWLATHAN